MRLEGDNPGIEVTSLVGGQFKAAIPLQPDTDASTLQVMVDIGKPQENVLVVAPGGVSYPVTYSWFLDLWAMAHIGQLIQDLSSPYVGRYMIAGWQGGAGSTLVRQYSGPAGDATESTTFKLTVTPSP